MNLATAARAGRLGDELVALAAAGITVTDQAMFEDEAVWTCALEHDYETATITVRIGSGFPWFPPVVTSPEPFLQRHQVPTRDGSFCLDRSDAPWWTPEHSIADLLLHLQRLLNADTEGSARRDEADMPEPASAFLTAGANALVLLPAALLDTDTGVPEGALELTRIAGNTPRWLVTAIRVDATSLTLASKAEISAVRLNKKSVALVPWKDIGELRDRNGVEKARRTVIDMAPPLPRHRKHKLSAHRWRAVTFSEEGPTRNRTRRAWAFAEVSAQAPRWAATQALSIQERDSRRAELIGLGDARVTVFGIGALGGTLAMLLAQAGVRDFHLVDHDSFDINNGVRHVLPAGALGHQKATAVAELLNVHQPFCRARAHDLNIGAQKGSMQKTSELIAESDLVVDTTGAVTVSRFLGAAAASHQVTAVHAALIAGAENGYVFVRRPGTGCLDHFLSHPGTGLPATADLPNSTPYGCSHPAVSCAPFEPAQLAVHAARTVAGVIPTRGYPSFVQDWLVVRLSHGTSTVEGSLPKAVDCHYCDP